jgi:hypothetical protein
VDPVEESGGCAENGDAATSQENGGAAAGCSNVASGPTAAELLELVDAASIALDAGESKVARAQLQTLAEAVRALRHGCRRDGV